jgi:hypothetical protein
MDAGANAASDAADGDAGTGDAAGTGAVHAFGLLACAGGLGVTRARHDERDANTPW